MPVTDKVTSTLQFDHAHDQWVDAPKLVVTGVIELQGTCHPVSHGRDSSLGRATSIFAFPYINPCNVIIILVTPSLF